MEWDDVVPLACAAYNFLSNEHSKESPVFLMFGREARIPLNTMFQSQIRYYLQKSQEKKHQLISHNQLNSKLKTL